MSDMQSKTEEKLRRAFREITEGQDKFTRRMAIKLAKRFAMKPKFLIMELERLGLLKPGAWRWFEVCGGIT